MTTRPFGYPPAHLLPGEVAYANVLNPRENPAAGGKLRPVVLVAPDDSSAPSGWSVMGLTTKDQYADGNPRTPIVDPVESGLGGPGFLWAHHLTWITEDSIHLHLGYATTDFQQQLIDVLGLDESDRALMAKWLATRGACTV